MNDLISIWEQHWQDKPIEEYPDYHSHWFESHRKILDRYLFKGNLDDFCGFDIVNAGCGLGQWVFYCAKQAAGWVTRRRIIGLDIAKDTICRLNIFIREERFNNRKMRFMVDDIRDIKSIKENSCHLVFSFGVVEHFKEDRLALEQFYRILCFGGYAIISVPNLYTTTTLTEPIARLFGIWGLGKQKHYTRKSLRKIIPEGFEIIEENILPTGELLGSFAIRMPLIGKWLLGVLQRISLFIEKRSKVFGFMRYVVIKKRS